MNRDDINQEGATPILPSSNPAGRRASRLFWVVALGLSVLWHAAWGFGLIPVFWPPVRPIPSKPAVSFMPANKMNAGTDSDVRVLWSPVLFSLPTAVGFSRPMLTDRAGLQPPQFRNGIFTNYLGRETSETPATGIVFTRSIEKMISEPRRHDHFVSTRTFFDSSIVISGKVFSVNAMNGLARHPTVDQPLPQHDWIDGNEAWESIVWVAVGTNGLVTRAFLETPTRSEKLNSLLTQTVRAWRWDPAPTGFSGRIVFRNMGRFRPELEALETP